MRWQTTGRRKVVVLHVLIMAALVCPIAASPQSTEQTAKNLYRTVEESVFLIYTNDANGQPLAFGSGFLVSPRRIITNEHVIEGGTPVLAVGPVRLPLKIIRTDRVNDLALLEVDTALTSTPLKIDTEKILPGETIFAIGNPEGLEKSISQGIISGLRDKDTRELLQITSPISHGSSGGPILNTGGQVIGVAVGMLVEGQNLNFAVPAKFVEAIMREGSASGSRQADISTVLAELQATLTKFKASQYSSEENSPYQQQLARAKTLLNSVVEQSSDVSYLRKAACAGTYDGSLSDAGLAAAQKALTLLDDNDGRALWAFMLYDRAEDEAVRFVFAEKDSPEQVQASSAEASYLLRSAQAAERVSQGSGKGSLVSMHVLGRVRHDQEDWSSSLRLLAAAVQTPITFCDSDLAPDAYRDLIGDATSLGKAEDAEHWFRQYASRYTPTASEWDTEGDRRSSAKDPHNAADAYERAAQNSFYGYDSCFAATQAYIDPATDADRVLRDGRACIDASASSSNDNKKYFDRQLPIVYQFMADILEGRGVYEQALQYAKESLNLQPSRAFALDLEAKIYEDLQRYSECISAAQQAIRASDGKFAYMQFRLGSCYFDSEDWGHAAASFRVAADEDKTDATAAFNVALSYQRQGFTVDCKEWAAEALRRKPDSELRTKIQILLR